MEARQDQDGVIEGLLSNLEHAAKTPAKQRAIKVSNVIGKLCSSAHDLGLTNTSMSKLVDTITLPNELDQASLRYLIRNLYPAGKVSDAIVIKVVGSLGHGKAKPKYAAQAALLKWLVMVYDVLENQKVLSQLYPILFNLLDTIALRTPLCHVLSLITRRKHVRPYRIQVLMELTRQAGNEPPLVGLMRVYKDYYPDIIVGDMVSGRASVFTHPNHEWRQRLREIQEMHFHRMQDGLQLQHRAFKLTRKGTTGKIRTRSSLIPEVHTSHALESSVTLEEIEDVDDFVEKLERIEPPNQLVAVIGDSLLQKYLQLRSSNECVNRVDRWLIAFFEDQLQSQEQAENKILEMLEAVREYTRYTKELPPACLAYLKSMVYTWNGITGRKTILDLLAYAPLGPFQELYESIFQPLEDAVLEDATVESKITLLAFYKSLLDRWTASLIAQPRTAREVAAAISSLISHTNTLSLTILQSSQSVGSCASILSFYESAAAIISYPTLRSTARITTPPAELIYALHFTTSLSTLSRLCAILALYKRALEIAMAPKVVNSSSQDRQSYPKEYVNHFNGFLMDVCNCVWRARALNTTDPNALGCLVTNPVTLALTKYIVSLDASLTLPSLFSFSTSPVFCLLAISYIRELEDVAEDNIDRRHAGPVSQASLKQLDMNGGLHLSWQDYKLGVLQLMENKGAAGVGELMYNTMTHLMTARNNKA